MSQIRVFIFLLVAAVVVLAGCGYSDSDVLASYQAGGKTVSITRGDFYSSLNRWTRQRTLSSRQAQERSLRSYIFGELKTVEAEKQGLGNTKEFKKDLKEVVDKRLALSAYLKEKRPQFFTMERGKKLELSDFSFKVRVVSHLVVRVQEKKSVQVPDPNRFKKMQAARKSIKDPKKLAARLKQLAVAKVSKQIKLTPAEVQAEEKKALERVKKAQAELKSGKSFAAVARAYGQDGTATKGGYFGFVYPHQQRLDPPFREAALKLKAGETSDIVKGKFGYHLIRCDAIKTITDSNIRDYFPTPAEKKAAEQRIAAMKGRLKTLKGKQKEQYKKRIASTEKQLTSGYDRQMGQTLRGFWFSSVMQYLDGLKNSDPNVKIHEDALKGNDLKAVIFEINHPEYTDKLTLGEYLDAMKKVNPRRLAQYGVVRGRNDKRPFTYEERRAYLNWHVTFSLLTYSAYKSGVVKGEAFKKQVDKLRKTQLAKAMQEKITKDVKVTDAGLLAEYTKNKTRYASRKRVRGAGGKWKTVSTQMTFTEAREKVRKALESSKKRNILLGWQSKLFQTYKIKLFPEKFEIIKPKKKPRRQSRRPQMRGKRPMPKKK